MEKQTVARSGFSLVWRGRKQLLAGYVTDVGQNNIFDKNSISVQLAVAALASVRAGRVELIAGQFQSHGRKKSLGSDSSSESPRPP